LTFRERITAPAFAVASDGAGSQAALEKPHVKCALMGLAGLLTIAGIAALGSTEAPRATTGDFQPLSVPKVATPWTPLDDSATDWRPSFAGADVELKQSYGNGGQIVDFYLAYYTHQRQGAEIVNQQNNLAGESTWFLSEGDSIEAVLEGLPHELRSARLASSKAGRIIWYWYWVGGTFTASPVVAKLHQVKARLLGDSQAAAVIAISTTFSETPADSTTILRDFLGHIESMSRFLEKLTSLTSTDRSRPTRVARLNQLRD
jgi:EpsI family protein